MKRYTFSVTSKEASIGVFLTDIDLSMYDVVTSDKNVVTNLLRNWLKAQQVPLTAYKVYGGIVRPKGLASLKQMLEDL